MTSPFSKEDEITGEKITPIERIAEFASTPIGAIVVAFAIIAFILGLNWALKVMLLGTVVKTSDLKFSKRKRTPLKKHKDTPKCYTSHSRNDTACSGCMIELACACDTIHDANGEPRGNI